MTVASFLTGERAVDGIFEPKYFFRHFGVSNCVISSTSFNIEFVSRYSGGDDSIHTPHSHFKVCYLIMHTFDQNVRKLD
jgi:hypothetical protein